MGNTLMIFMGNKNKMEQDLSLRLGKINQTYNQLKRLSEKLFSNRSAKRSVFETYSSERIEEFTRASIFIPKAT